MLPEPVIEAEIADLATDEATAITSRIRAWVRQCPIDDIKRAYFGRIWLAMGYESWSEWCDCELDGFKLPAVERREIVTELSDSGMSNPSIADVIGVHEKTVRRDLATSANAEVERKVTGKDGREIDTSNIGKRHGNSKLQIRVLKATKPQLSAVADALEAVFTGTFDKTCTPDIARDAAKEMRVFTARINKVLRMLETAPVVPPTEA